jgi:hypothetical protein
MRKRAGEERLIAKIRKHFKWLTVRAVDLVGRNVGRFVGRKFSTEIGVINSCWLGWKIEEAGCHVD